MNLVKPTDLKFIEKISLIDFEATIQDFDRVFQEQIKRDSNRKELKAVVNYLLSPDMQRKIGKAYMDLGWSKAIFEGNSSFTSLTLIK